jgi:hypothetical protein
MTTTTVAPSGTTAGDQFVGSLQSPPSGPIQVIVCAAPAALIIAVAMSAMNATRPSRRPRETTAALPYR